MFCARLVGFRYRSWNLILSWQMHFLFKKVFCRMHSVILLYGLSIHKLEWFRKAFHRFSLYSYNLKLFVFWAVCHCCFTVVSLLFQTGLFSYLCRNLKTKVVFTDIFSLLHGKNVTSKLPFLSCRGRCFLRNPRRLSVSNPLLFRSE